MSQAKPTQELVPVDDPARMAAVLAGLEEMEVEDSSEFTAAQILRILNSETEADAFLEIPAYNTEELENVTFTVLVAKLLPSGKGKGRGAFVAAEIVRHDTGENCIFTTSAARPAARICWLQVHEKLPRDVKVTVLSEATGKGHKLYGLELVG